MTANPSERKRDSRQLPKVTIALFVLIILPSLLINCNGGGIVPTATKTPTLTPPPSSTATLSPTPTSTSCPTLNSQFSPNKVLLSPVLVVVLFDNEQTPFDSLELMHNVLQNVSKPGDSIAMFRSGYRWHQFDISKVIIHDSPKLDVPDIILSPTSIHTQTPRATLTPRSSATPHSTPDVSEEDIFSQSQTRTAFPPQATQTVEVYETQVMETEVASRATSTAFKATATEIAALNNCAIQAWNEEYAEIDARWQNQKATHKAEFLTHVAGTIVPGGESTQTISQTTPTPYTQAEVYDGLASASLVFSNLCDEDIFSRCILIILDNLEDWRPSKPPEYDIQLDNVDVISILPNCEEVFSPSPLCGPAQEHWTPQFILFGANSVQYHNNRDIMNYLVEQIDKDR